MADLVSSKQVNSVDQHHDEFVSLLNHLNLPENYALSIFISNLKLEIGQYLNLFKPKDLVEGYMIARQVESILVNTGKRLGPVGSGVQPHPPPLFPAKTQPTPSPNLSTHQNPGSSGKKPPTKTLSQVEMEEKRKGLCFRCRAKYSPGHKCMKPQLYQLLLEPQIEGDGEEFQDCQESLEHTEPERDPPTTPVLSLHVIQGS